MLFTRVKPNHNFTIKKIVLVVKSGVEKIGFMWHPFPYE
jgi:hypothetical protein